MQGSNKFLVIAILDGWGVSENKTGNAIASAKTPNIRRFLSSFPHTVLGASGESVGLPRGEDGNSETGHLNLGAGRIVYQSLARINMSIADGTFSESPALLGAIEHVKKNDSKMHLLGLVGEGGVHSNIEHLYALIHLCAKSGLSRVYIHVITDGRDSPPFAARNYIKNLKDVLEREKCGQIATVMGRYWAMDRDRRWDRTARAYFALTRGEGNYFSTPEEAVDDAYEKGKGDEFIEPAVLLKEGLIEDNDATIFFNFRIDRPRQLTASFVADDLTHKNLVFETENEAASSQDQSFREVFARGKKLINLYFVTMTEYSKILTQFGAKIAIERERVDMPLGRVISEAGLRQLRISESEKERFVTYYFNGQREMAFSGEERIIIPSPNVATYDLKPEMSAYEINNAFLQRFRGDHGFSFCLINFANPDMVGHTGNFSAAVSAVEITDECIGKIGDFVISNNGSLIITADHGNVEEMLGQDDQTDTEHSTNPVPFVVASNEFVGKSIQLTSGILADVAPTSLALMGLSIPSSMTGRDLLSDI